MVLESFPLWAKITLYAYLLGGLFIYTMLSRIKMVGINLIKQRDRILISAFYPLLIIVSLIVLPIVLLAFMVAPIKGKVFNIRINRIKKL